MEETEFLHKEKIDTQGDVAMVVQERRRDGDGKERWGPGGSGGAGCFAFKGRNIGAIDGEGTVCIVGSDGAVDDEDVL